MRKLMASLVPLMIFAGCGDVADPAANAPAPQAAQSELALTSPSVAEAPSAALESGPSRTALVEARRRLKTTVAPNQPGKPAPEPPANIFRLIRYDSPVGKLAAYLTPDPGDGKKHPAIVWITGGDCNTIDELWADAPRDNDQTAAAYRKAGIIMMFPSLRGGNDNPGQHEGFFGEVDDVVAAGDHLAAQPYVDPKRIYLGGHSTGGTLVMLVAESTDHFRAAFSFGPAHDVRGYGGQYAPFDTGNPKEFDVRAPFRWLNSVRRPLFVFEGTEKPCNLPALKAMAQLSQNPLIRFERVQGLNHFSILAPANDLIAAKIMADNGPTMNIAFSNEELNALARGLTGPSAPRQN